MPISHALWTVGSAPNEVQASTLASEQLLEDMIVAEPRILSEEWMLIGRQEDTGRGGRVDLLAMAPDGSLVLAELKRDRTPREVVAQALDYASWVEDLEPEEIAAIYARFRLGQSLEADFQARFGQPLDEETVNDSHQVVVVASSLDASTERIIGYLNRRGVAVNVLFFQVFEHGEQKLLSRAWLIDPVEVQVQAAATGSGRQQEPWNGEFYVSFGDPINRRWDEAEKYGFISAGGEFCDEVQHRDGSGIRLVRNSKRCCHGELQPPHCRGAGPDCRLEGRRAERQSDRPGSGPVGSHDQPRAAAQRFGERGLSTNDRRGLVSAQAAAAGGARA